MKKLLIAAAMALCLGGCANFNPFASFQNVSTQSLASAEESYGGALAIAVAYRNACDQRLIPSSCRTIVKSIQIAENYAYGQLKVARDFVKNNPTVDATVIITTAQQAVAAFQAAVPATNGAK